MEPTESTELKSANAGTTSHSETEQPQEYTDVNPQRVPPTLNSTVGPSTAEELLPAAVMPSWEQRLARMEHLIQQQESIFHKLRDRLESLEKPEVTASPSGAARRSVALGGRRLSTQSPPRPGTAGQTSSAVQRTPVQRPTTAGGGPTRVSGYAGSPSAAKPKTGGVVRTAGAAAASRRPPTGNKPRTSAGGDAAASPEGNQSDMRTRSLTRQRSVDRWNVDSRLKELEDIRASNFQALERSNSAFSRTHSLRKVANGQQQASRSAQVDSANAAEDALSASAYFEGEPSGNPAAPSYTEYLRRASAVSARKTPRRLSTAKIIAKTPRAAMARIVRAMVVANGGAPPSAAAAGGRTGARSAQSGSHEAGRTTATSKTAATDAKRPQWQSTTKVVAGRTPGAVPAGSRKTAAQRSVS